MKEQVELELKTLVTQQQFDQLKAHFEPLSFETQVNTYYLTKDTKHYAFRIRKKNGTQLFTLKQHKNGQVIEYEKYFEGNFFNDREILEVLNQFGIKSPYSIMGQLITQRAVYDTGMAELCFDINSYNGITDYEIEYEVKKPHDHQKAFEDILSLASVEYVSSWGSKYKRCLSTKK